MAGTYSQIYIHVIFAVKGRHNMLKEQWREELFKYISGIVKEKGHKPIIINGYLDHVHCFIGLKPSIAISDLVRDIKNNSSNFLLTKNFSQEKNFVGRKDMGFSPIHIPILIWYINIYRIKKIIIGRKASEKNILIC